MCEIRIIMLLFVHTKKYEHTKNKYSVNTIFAIEEVIICEFLNILVLFQTEIEGGL